MSLKQFISIGLLLAGCGQGFSQTPVWTQMPGSPSGTTRHDDIYMLDATNGWTARGRAGIFKTTDGGNTWVQKTNGVSSTTHFRCIGFATTLRGWAGNLGTGSYDTIITDTNVLYETFDGGETWTNRPGFGEVGMKGLCSLSVLDSQTIYGVGRVRGPAHFIKSTDAGTNWTVVDMGTNGLGVMGGIMDVYFKDKTNGFVVGMNTNTFGTNCTSTYYGRIARTTNGGASWFPVATTTIPCCYFWKMSWPTPEVGYVSLQQNVTSNTNLNNTLIFYKTTDGGATWNSNGVPYTAIAPAIVTNSDGFYWQGVGFISTNEGWAGGSALASPNNFLHTIDGGASWTPVGYTSTLSINRFRILSPTLAYASGQKLHIFRVPLAITAQPQSQTNLAGSTVIFNATGQGTAPITFQWRFNGANISGAITNSYSITNVQATHVGSYDLIVSDYSGSVTSSVATLSVSGSPVITMQPQSLTIGVGSNATFSVIATGVAPLSYQWRFNGASISNATSSSFTRTSAQTADAGGYSVVITNSAGSITSSIAILTVALTNVLLVESFDGYVSPSVVTNSQTTNGYKIFFGAISGVEDFKAIFGFDYSTVTFPISIPPAPHSSGGTTKGLFLAVNKDATAAAAAVNLYPLGVSASGNFSLKFDLWLNWTNLGTATEHALFGINHSGNVTNRVSQSTSDGLFFAVDGNGNTTSTSTTSRDYSVFRGGGTGAIPIFMYTNNTTFGPTPPLGPQFDNGDAGFVSLFPSKAISGYPTTAGTPGLGWVTGEVRQENNLITCLLNNTIIAQYTNTFAYTNGNIMIGYNDTLDSLGDTNDFVIFDNIRVEYIFLSPALLLSPSITGNNFSFSFASETNATYTVQRATNLTTASWTTYTNVVGNGSTNTVSVPLTNNAEQQYFRVNRP